MQQGRSSWPQTVLRPIRIPACSEIRESYRPATAVRSCSGTRSAAGQYDVRVAKMDEAGTTLDDALVTSGPSLEAIAGVVPDGAGGAIVAWYDSARHHPGHLCTAVRRRRHSSMGQRRPDLRGPRDTGTPVDGAGRHRWCLFSRGRTSEAVGIPTSTPSGSMAPARCTGRSTVRRRARSQGAQIAPHVAPRCIGRSHHCLERLPWRIAVGVCATTRGVRYAAVDRGRGRDHRSDAGLGLGSSFWAPCQAERTRRSMFAQSLFVDASTGERTTRMRVQRVDPLGAPSWSDTGAVVRDTTGFTSLGRIVSDGAGGAYMAWSDARAGAYDIYAQACRFGRQHPVGPPGQRGLHCRWMAGPRRHDAQWQRHLPDLGGCTIRQQLRRLRAAP